MRERGSAATPDPVLVCLLRRGAAVAVKLNCAENDLKMSSMTLASGVDSVKVGVYVKYSIQYLKRHHHEHYPSSRDQTKGHIRRR